DARLGMRAGLFDVLVPAAMAIAVVVGRLAGGRRLWGAVAVMALAYIGVGYPLTLRPDDLHYFGSLSTLAPNLPAVDSLPGHQPALYRTNGFGFRGTDFDERRRDGVVRVALIGDSYVFGIGVAADGTLAARLAAELSRRWPDDKFEVLNLGIPGDN